MNYIPQLLSVIQALFCPTLYRSHVKLCLQLCWMPYRQAGNISCLDENPFALLKKIWWQQSQLNQTRHSSSITGSHRTRMDLPSKPLPCFLLPNTPPQAKAAEHPRLVDPNHRTPNFMWQINLSVSSDPPIWPRAVQDNPLQCGASAHFGRTPRLFSSTRLRRGLVNTNTLCIRNTSGWAGLKYPLPIQSLDKVSSLLRKKSFQHVREEGRRQTHQLWDKHLTEACNQKMPTLLLRNSSCCGHTKDTRTICCTQAQPASPQRKQPNQQHPSLSNRNGHDSLQPPKKALAQTYHHQF